MRTAQELIHELAEEAQQLEVVALVVAFADRTAILPYEPNAEHAMIAELTQQIQQGGTPVVVIGLRALAECSGEPWVDEYFRKLLDHVAERLRAQLLI
jgi:hypothetical protein